MVNALIINSADNVAVALRDLAQGTGLEFTETREGVVTTREAIPFGHKVALQDIAQGEEVIKYGARIGVATSNIASGEHVHVHNLRSVRGVIKS